LILLKSAQGISIWPRENTNGWSATIKDISGIGEFLSTSILPPPPLNTSPYSYDNDGDLMGASGCCAGVNIYIYNTTYAPKYFDIVDDIIDNGDGSSSGRIRSLSGNAYIMYNLATKEDLSY